MEQLKDFSDGRLILDCIYCGASAETREHVPSKVFLDAPLPENLPVVDACRDCNNGFSLDEEYFACFVECALVGKVDPESIGRSRIANIVRRSPALGKKIATEMASASVHRSFGADPERVRNVIVKLARGHAAFELSQPCKGEPTSAWWIPLSSMAEGQREEFESFQVLGPLGEVGSRATRREMVLQLVLQSKDGVRQTIELVVNDWILVQEGRYRYHAIDDGDAIRIKLVISEYLACEVTWISEQTSATAGH